MNKKTILILLSIIFLIGLSLRLFHLSNESLWTDEAFSLHIVESNSVTEVIEKTKVSEVVPPGYYLLLHYWVKFVGNSEFWLRLPSIIFGVLSIIVIYLLAKEMDLGSKEKTIQVALLSAFFLATSMLQVLYSQEARIYSLFSFLSLFSTLCFVKLYNGNKKVWRYIYTLSLMASLYVNYLAVLLFVGHFLGLFWNLEKKKKMFRPLLIIYSYVLVFSLPLFPVALYQYRSVGAGATQAFMNLGVPYFFAKFGLFMFALPSLFILLLALIILFRFKEKAREKMRFFQDYPTIFILMITLFDLLYLFQTGYTILKIPIFRVPITNSYFLIRHSLFLFSMVYIFLAFIIIYKLNNSKRILAILLILIINISALSIYYTTITKPQWNEAVSYVQKQTPENPLFLMDKGGLSNTFTLEYYSQKHFGHKPKIIELTKIKERSNLLKMSKEQLYSQIGSKKEFWLMLVHNKETKDHYKNILDARFTSLEIKEFSQIKLIRYKNERMDNLK